MNSHVSMPDRGGADRLAPSEKTLSSVDTSASTVLFVTYGNGHIGKVAPVVNALNAKGISTTVIALTLGYRQALDLGLIPKGYRDFLHLVDRDQALSFGAQLLSQNSHPDVDPFESMCYLGINYAEWVNEFGADAAANKYASGGRRSFLPIKFLGSVIDEIKPMLVVSTGSPRSEQAALEAAVARGIPTLTMLDLLGMPPSYYPANHVFADRITVASQAAKTNLQTCGVDASKIEVTGCPAYDRLFDAEHPIAAKNFLTRMGWTGLQVVLWTGILEESASNVPAEYLGTGLGVMVEQTLRNWVDSRRDVALIVRYHPTQYHLFKNLGDHKRVYVSNPIVDSLPPQLHACDCVVTQMSTVGYEGALIGKRLLALSFSPMVINFDFDYGKIGLGESVHSLSDLIPALNMCKGIKTNQDVLPPAGRATPRVIDQILRLVSNFTTSLH